MKNNLKLIILIFLFPFIIFGQNQLGSDIDGENQGDEFGSSVSLSSNGNIVAVGAPNNDGNGDNSGHVRVYENINGAWTQIGQDIDGEAQGDRSGLSISLSSNGDIIAIGGRFNDGNGDNSGHVRVYENINGTWTQIGQDIDGELAGDEFGVSLSLSSDGNIVAIGARVANFSSTGYVKVYINNLGTWTQIGETIDGEEVFGNEFGWSVSLSSNGNIVAVGDPTNEENGFQTGHVRVYENINGTWTQIGQDIDGESPVDQFGANIALSSDGSIVAIGASGNDNNGQLSGQVKVFKNIEGIWTQIGQDINGEFAQEAAGSGISISSDGTIVSLGARGSTFSTIEGIVRSYKYINGVWNKIGEDIAGESSGDQFGNSIALSTNGNIIAIGAAFNDGNGGNSGHLRVYDLSAVLSSNDLVLSKFNLFPNPTINQFTIQLQDGIELQKVNIYNSLGHFISSSQKHVIKTSLLSTGIYYIEIITNKGKATKKIVIK